MLKYSQSKVNSKDRIRNLIVGTTVFLIVITTIMSKCFQSKILDSSSLNLYDVSSTLNRKFIDKNPKGFFESKYPGFQTSFIPLYIIDQFLEYLSPKCIFCSNLKTLGGVVLQTSEGNRILSNYKKVCYDLGFSVNKVNACNVISFGVAREWSFDEVIAQSGCKVHYFDPSLTTDDKIKNITSYKIGISNFQGNLQWMTNAFKVDTYGSILSQINLSETQFSYLKMDVEGSEKEFFLDVLTKSPQLLLNVEQIGMEIHIPQYHGDGSITGNNSFVQFWRSFQLLERLDFILLSADISGIPETLYTHNNKTLSCCYELLWAKKRLLS